ncbi:alpha/beta hydrolase family protein [Dyella acidiphila]|uniref:Alpha/beta fold hydrolase n=1 Tax=Dyella acidiphila TaxID=2775866 RepID=A0ABR9G6T6_9GAMM|nr:alpha/beta fold hydrolase [Dyella acidiphila]MBE1159764.1 alpha/beta fold hydrolase [Dyella acidiphila]
MSASLDSSATVAAASVVVPVVARDGARSELIVVRPASEPRQILYWLPAMGVPAKHYLPLAEALAARGMAMALHEWRGIGSSDRRAGKACDWGYRQLLEADIPAGVEAARARWPQATLWLGGHSLGGQLSCLYAGLHPQQVAGIALIASGAPYWRRFPFSLLLLVAYALANPLAALMGYLPGRRIGFGGNEARGVIADWSRSGRSGRYSADGMAVDFNACLASLTLPVLALRLQEDWLVPPASLAWLLGLMPKARAQTAVVSSQQLAGQRADHFSWMKTPAALAAQLAVWMEEASRTA